jgi:ABC-type nitrate/sulfonate/bicarbonate transport system permease component
MLLLNKKRIYNFRFIFGLIVFFLIWTLISHLIGSSRLPKPLSVIKAFFSIISYKGLVEIGGADAYGIIPHLLYSLKQLVIGFLMGMFFGIGLGLLMASSDFAERLLTIPVEIARAIPPLVAIPFFIIWFGPGSSSQIGMMIFYTTVRMIIYTYEAVQNVPSVSISYAKTMGATKGQIYRTVIIEDIIPELAGGLRTILPTSFGIQVVAEMLGSSMGIGRVFSILIMVLAVDRIIAAIFWVALVANLLDYSVLKITRYITRWEAGFEN